MSDKKYYLGMYEKSMPNRYSLREKLEICKEVGFDWMEISIDETDEKLSRLDWSLEQINALKKDTIEVGCPILTMCLSGHRKYPLGSSNPETEQRGLDIMRKAIDFANVLGIRIIQLAGYDVYYEEGNEETKARFIKNLKKAAIMAAEKGVLMGFETMETPFMDTVEKSMEYVHAVDSPYLQVYPDIGNLTNASKIYGKPVVEDILTGKGHIVAAHLKETVVGKYREIPFGTGHTEFVEDIKCLKELGVRMFTGEFWDVGKEDWKQDCIDANAFLRDKLEKAFHENDS